MGPKQSGENRRKHGVSFHEVAVLGNPLALAYQDPDHSAQEQRFITVATSSAGRLLIAAHADRGASIRIISARKTTRRERADYEQKNEKRKPRDELRKAYVLPKLRDGIREKYAADYKAGTNLVHFSPDVAEHLPNDRSVNSALRKLIRVAKRPLRRSH